MSVLESPRGALLPSSRDRLWHWRWYWHFSVLYMSVYTTTSLHVHFSVSICSQRALMVHLSGGQGWHGEKEKEMRGFPAPPSRPSWRLINDDSGPPWAEEK